MLVHLLTSSFSLTHSHLCLYRHVHKHTPRHKPELTVWMCWGGVHGCTLGAVRLLRGRPGELIVLSSTRGWQCHDLTGHAGPMQGFQVLFVKGVGLGGINSS